MDESISVAGLVKVRSLEISEGLSMAHMFMLGRRLWDPTDFKIGSSSSPKTNWGIVEKKNGGIG